MEIRFDSFGTSSKAHTIRFAGLLETIRASTVGEVLPALERVEAAVARGRHAAGFVAYEAAAAMDNAMVTHPGAPDVPLVLFGIFESRSDGPLSIDTEESDGEGAEGLKETEERQGDTDGKEHAGIPPDPADAAADPQVRPDIDRAEYDRAIARILDYITAGDSYQVNFSMRLRGGYNGSPAALYRRICHAQRADFCASLRFDDRVILSASPELFFHRVGNHIRMKPMKGTGKRGRWTAEDDEMASALASSPKDRAENLMIVDLLRNDLGRVATFGTVQVASLYDIERYPTLYQMTSTVEAELPEGTSLTDLFRALFPCGSVTGAPKVRTMEIIEELESSPRGVYTGAIGFASPDESMFSVAIRTVMLDLAQGEYELGVGSGITADSAASAEYEECMTKGAFLHTPAPDIGLIESLRLDLPGGYLRLPAHIQRMAGSARYFSIPFDPGAAEDELVRASRELAGGSYKVRLLLTRAGQLSSTVERIPPRLPPARLGLAGHRVRSSDPLLFHKTTFREPFRRALEECRGCDDVILRNERDEITESCTGNVVVELDGELVTPPLSSGLLGGIQRAEVVREGLVRERVLTVDDLQRATRVFVINSVRGWRSGRLLPGFFGSGD